MFLLLGRPLAAITSGLTNWLSGMTGTSVIILGVILGLMMCFDLGGPVNKAAYAFATAGSTSPTLRPLRIMAAVMAAGMVPAARDGSGRHRQARSVHRAGTGKWQGGLASRRIVHL
jgi:fructose-specific phosphotransferase system IIC component